MRFQVFSGKWGFGLIFGLCTAASNFAIAAAPNLSGLAQSKPPKVIVPADKKVAAAMEQALPAIERVLSIHQCMKEPESLRELNAFALPGLDMIKRSGQPAYGFPNSQFFMKFHDRSKCVGTTQIDNWSMPALNALLFRSVFFADDSGETVNFLYLFKKTDEGTWLLSQLEPVR